MLRGHPPAPFYKRCKFTKVNFSLRYKNPNRFFIFSWQSVYKQHTDVKKAIQNLLHICICVLRENSDRRRNYAGTTVHMSPEM